MKNRALFFSVVIAFIQLNCIAQGFERKVYTRTSKEILKEIPVKQPRYTDHQLFNPICELLCIGEYSVSVYHYDKINSNPLFSFTDSVEHSTDMINYKAISAKDYILEQAKNTQIIIFNENHNQSLNRFYVHTLLKSFYELGFRYLALEALFTDSVVNKNKYPLLTDGFYISDPQFANMVREACSLGFRIVKYETLGQQLKNREYFQALNIKQQIFENDPNAKAIIYCGYGHGDESEVDTAKMMMAARLKRLTGINPFTIEQQFLINHPDHNYDPSIYGSIRSNYPVIFFNKATKAPFIPFGSHSSYDVYVYQPAIDYKIDRPIWLFNEDIYKPFEIEKQKITIAYPVLVMAYVADEEGNFLIPFDCVELKSKKDHKCLALKPGNYKLVIRNDNNQEQIFDISFK